MKITTRLFLLLFFLSSIYSGRVQSLLSNRDKHRIHTYFNDRLNRTAEGQRLGAFYADYLGGAGPMAGGEPLKNASPLNYRHLYRIYPAKIDINL